MKLFRGMSEDTLVRRLVLRGWPEATAQVLAEWLCDRKAPPPRWEEMEHLRDR